jgi:hypothetical protein
MLKHKRDRGYLEAEDANNNESYSKEVHSKEMSMTLMKTPARETSGQDIGVGDYEISGDEDAWDEDEDYEARREVTDEITVETRVTEVKTVKMSMSQLGAVSVEEKTEVLTNTGLNETRRTVDTGGKRRVLALPPAAPPTPPPALPPAPPPPLMLDSSFTTSEISLEGRHDEDTNDTQDGRDEEEARNQEDTKLTESLVMPEASHQSQQIREKSLEKDHHEEEPDIGADDDNDEDEDNEDEVAQAPELNEVFDGDDDDEWEAEQYMEIMRAVSAYEPENDDALSLHEGERVELIDSTDYSWWRVRKLFDNRYGNVPAAYLKSSDDYKAMVEDILQKNIEKMSAETSKLIATPFALYLEKEQQN